MDVLSHQWQRMLFRWQHSVFGDRWLTLLLVSVLVLGGLVMHAWWQQQQLQQALQRPQPKPLLQPLPKTAVASAPTIWQQWPAEDDADRISAEILAQVDAMGMIFERAEFQSLPVERSHLQIQRIKLPLKGDYLQVRQFLQTVLQAYPSLALSQFKLQRSDVMQTGIEAYVEFSLYTRKRGQS
jgi:hypothetical protein